jgi:prepilin-type processing-associated H-X9-DG protein
MRREVFNDETGALAWRCDLSGHTHHGGNIWLPRFFTNQHFDSFATSPENQRRLVVDARFQISDVRVNDEVTDNDFRLTYEPGTVRREIENGAEVLRPVRDGQRDHAQAMTRWARSVIEHSGAGQPSAPVQGTSAGWYFAIVALGLAMGWIVGGALPMRRRGGRELRAATAEDGSKPAPARGAVTLLEVLVTISIIGMLMSLLLPAVQASRESARRTQCQNHLRQQSLALLNHETAHGHLPSNGWGYMWVGDPDRGTGPSQPGGWIYATLPYLERADLRRLGAGQPHDEKQKSLALLLTYPLSFFNCPSRRPASLYPQLFQPFNTAPARSAAKSDYAVNGGDVFFDVGMGPMTLADGDDPNYDWPKPPRPFTGVCYLRSQVALAQITDGLSHTYLVGEKNVRDYASGVDEGDDQSMYSGDDFDIARWTPRGWTPLFDTAGTNNYGRFGSAHPTGCNFVFCDGSVRTIRFEIDPEAHRRLGNRQDGELIDDAWLQ